MSEQYDIHTHILPRMDDGPKSVKESIEMLRRLKEQGVKNVIFTPHYYSDSESIDSFLQRRSQSYELIKNSIPDDMNIKLGSEVYVSDILFNRDDLTPLCLSNRRYILLEFPFYSSFHEKSLDDLQAIMYNYNVKPVLAHIERYKRLLDSIGAVERLVRLGCYLQVDISTFNDSIAMRKISRLFDRHLIGLIATDCHNMTTRTPAYSYGTKYIAAKYGRGYLEKIMDNAKEIYGD